MAKHVSETVNMSSALVESVAREIVNTSNDCNGVSTHGARCFKRHEHTDRHEGFTQFSGARHQWGRYRQA